MSFDLSLSSIILTVLVSPECNHAATSVRLLIVADKAILYGCISRPYSSQLQNYPNTNIANYLSEVSIDKNNESTEDELVSLTLGV